MGEARYKFNERQNANHLSSMELENYVFFFMLQCRGLVSIFPLAVHLLVLFIVDSVIIALYYTVSG